MGKSISIKRKKCWRVSAMNEFLKRLEEELDRVGSANKEEILSKYRRRFELAKEAGMSEREAIEKFGSIERILAEEGLCIPTEAREYRSYEVDISDSLAERIYFHLVDGDQVAYVVSSDLEKNLDVVMNEREMKIKDKTGGESDKKYGDMTVNIGRDLALSRVKISCVSAQCRFDDLKAKEFVFKMVDGKFDAGFLKAETIRISSVSGDISCAGIDAKNLNLKTVQSDADLGTVHAENASFYSVKGKIRADGEIKQSKVTTLNGSVLLNDKKMKPSLSEKFNGLFRKEKSEE